LAARIREARHSADTVLGTFTPKADLRWCAAYIARTPPDAVLIDTIFRAGLLAEPELSGINSVIIAHDVFHRRHLALATAGYRVLPAHLTREDEAARLSTARHIAAIQPEEAELLAALCPAQNVFVAAMPAIPAPPPPGQVPLTNRLVFVGSAALPNLDGLRWFFETAWPRLQRQGITLDLVGDCGTAFARLPPGVARLGRLESLAPALHRSALAIAPIRVGSGLKIKLLDYARHGLITVTTPSSLEGFAPDPESPFLTADTAEAFADAILQQLAAPQATDKALAYVRRHYGITASFAGLGRAIR
jgi:succinoglycan biosynthesis protein ExoO